MRQHTDAVRRMHEEQMEAEASHAKAMQEAIEEAADRTEEALEEAVDQQKKNIANAHKLQAESKVKEARELYAADIYDDALSASQEAIKLDRTNIDSYIMAALASAAKGMHAKAREYYQQQIALLRTSRSQTSPTAALKVLKSLPEDPELIQSFRIAFRTAFQANTQRWSVDPDCFELIGELIGFGLLDDAKYLTESLIERSNSILLQAYLFEINLRAGNRDSGGLVQFLQAVPFNSRGYARKDFLQAFNDERRFSQRTLDQIRSDLRERYEQWKPQIVNEILEEARRGASSSGAGFGCILTVIIFILAPAITLNLLRSSIQQAAIGQGVLTFIWAFGSLFMAVFVGVYGGYIYGRLQKAKSVGNRISSLEQQENEAWKSIVATHITIDRPPLPSVVFHIILVLAIPPTVIYFAVQYFTPRLILEEFNSGTTGKSYGIQYLQPPSGNGAVFTRESESRIEYSFSDGFPREGTLEWWIKVDSGYRYSNFKLLENQGEALIFTTDICGGDVAWPGSAWLWVKNDGGVVLYIATKKYQAPPAEILKADVTSFRFGEWHSIGISVGSKGHYIVVDGTLVASNPNHKQSLGSGGNQNRPVDKPTIGESVSGYWQNNRYECGFVGIVSKFRASPRQMDWDLSSKLPAH